MLCLGCGPSTAPRAMAQLEDAFGRVLAAGQAQLTTGTTHSPPTATFGTARASSAATSQVFHCPLPLVARARLGRRTHLWTRSPHSLARRFCERGQVAAFQQKIRVT